MGGYIDISRPEQPSPSLAENYSDRSTALSPADNSNEIVLTGRAVLHRERSPAVSLRCNITIAGCEHDSLAVSEVSDASIYDSTWLMPEMDGQAKSFPCLLSFKSSNLVKFPIVVESRSWRDRNLKFGPNCDLEVDNLEKNKFFFIF